MFKERNVEILAKAEYLNPSGSIKDRVARKIIEEAERNGEIKPGDTIVEPTSGNMGISLAMISALKGYRFIAVMPRFTSLERRRIIDFYGGKIVLTPSKENMAGSIRKAREICEELGAFMPNQFTNPNNVAVHLETTGKEILAQVNGEISAFVAGVGTGGTLIGVAKALRRENPDVLIVAVEPSSSAVLSGGRPGVHRIEGIGEGFIPEIVKRNRNLIDEIIKVGDEEAINTARQLTKKEGVFAGISSGANLYAAVKVAEKIRKGRIVTVFPDSADRYFTTELFNGRRSK